MRHAAHVLFEVTVAFVLIAAFAVLNLSQSVVLAGAGSLLVLFAVLGAFRIWR